MMNRLLLVAFFGIVGCEQPRFGDWRKEFQSKDYVQEIRNGELVLEVRHVPKELRQAVEWGISDTARMSAAFLDTLKRAAFIKGHLFMVTLKPFSEEFSSRMGKDLVYGQGNRFSTYQEAMETYQFGWRERIWLEYGDKKIPMSGYQMENTFGVSPERSFIISFPELGHTKASGKAKVDLVVEDLFPGLARHKLHWMLPVGEHEEKS